MAEFLRIIVATADEALRALIARVAAQHEAARVVAEVDSAHKLIEAVTYRRPRLVFVAADVGDMRGLEVAETLSRRYPGLYIAIVTSRSTVEEVRLAMKAGARECLFEPASADAVLRVIDHAGTSTEAVPERKGAVVAVLSSKGGVGKSTISVNLAIALKQLGVARLALVDGDLYFGDLATLLNIKPERTIYELSTSLDAEIADRFLCRHTTGIEVLVAPPRTEQAEEISPDRFRKILNVLQALYDYIIVDATVSAFDAMLATLDVADLGLVVSTLDVVCLKDVSQVLTMLNRLQFPPQNIMLVGNRFDERHSLKPKDAERTLGAQFAAMLPRDDRIVMAANRGVPTILSEPGALFVQKLRLLAKAIVAQVGRVERVPA